MGKGRHVVIHDVIHDDNEMGNRPIRYQDEFSHNLGNSPIDWCVDCAGDEVVELNGELLSGLGDEVLLEIVRGAELSGGEVELVIRLQWVGPSVPATRP